MSTYVRMHASSVCSESEHCASTYIHVQSIHIHGPYALVVVVVVVVVVVNLDAWPLFVLLVSENAVVASDDNNTNTNYKPSAHLAFAVVSFVVARSWTIHATGFSTSAECILVQSAISRKGPGKHRCSSNSSRTSTFSCRWCRTRFPRGVELLLRKRGVHCHQRLRCREVVAFLAVCNASHLSRVC